MIAELNRLIDVIDDDLSEDLDVASLARESGVTEYHLRRMFSSLVGMPLSEYVRRRRMTVAAAAVVAGDPLLDIAVRFGYGSTEAFGRAFRAVHGSTPAEVRVIDANGETRSDLKLPDQLQPEPPGASELSTKIRDNLAAEKEFYIIVQSAIGHEQIMDIKMMNA